MSAPEPSDARATPGRRSAAPVIAACTLAIFGFLPIVNWTPGAHDDPLYALLAAEWWSGTAIAIGVGTVLALLARHLKPIWRDSLPGTLDRLIARWPRAFVVCVAALAVALALALATVLFNRRPILIDEIAQIRQAQIFARGRLTMPLSSFPVFVSALHMVDVGGRVYSQYPPGGPAMLALGQLAGAPWVVDPIASGVSIIAFAALLRVAEPRRLVTAGALLLFAFAPFTLFMSSSHMNHVTTLAWLLIGCAGLATAMADTRPRPGLAFLSGLGFGAAATIRPVDALAFAAPAAVWYLARALREPPRWADAVAAVAGVALPVGAMLGVNQATTGSPLRFGYEVLWGAGHALGFHRAPWGIAHTPARGLGLLSLYVLRLQRYLFETPIPSLAPAIVALALTRRIRPIDRYLLASGILLLGLYFAYFHDGFYLGPRFVFPLVPVLALWTARFPAALRERLRRDSLVYRTAMYALAVSAIIAVGVSIPMRAAGYATTGATERWSTPRAAAGAGVAHALVFVRETWDSQLVARMWALGVSRPDAEWIYGRVDDCRLELAVDSLEHGSAAGPPTAAQATAALRKLVTDSGLVSRQDLAPGVSVRMQRGYSPDTVCVARVREMLEGVTPLAPLLVLDDGNVYVRDLHARDSMVLAAYPERPVFLLHGAGVASDALPRFYPISRDSLRARRY